MENIYQIKMARLKEMIEKNLVSIEKSLKELEITGNTKRFSILLIEYSDYKMARSLVKNKYKCLQAINILETMQKELKFMFGNINLKIISMDTSDKKKALSKR